MTTATLGFRLKTGRRVWRMMPFVALIATGGCFATRGDVRIIQGDIASLRTELLANQVAQRDALTQTLAMLQSASDSLARVSTRMVSMQGDFRGEMRAVREQFLQVQTLLGQSQATIARLRSEIETRANQSLPVPGPTAAPPAASTRPGSVVPQPVDSARTRVIGPNQLYVEGRDQLTRGSSATARTLFQELLSNFPDSDYAPDAQFWIAESLAKEKNLPAADAAYAAVVLTYPKAPKAPTALYKRAQLAIQQASTLQARQLLQQVVARFPNSDEAELATEQLKTLR